MKSSRKRVWDDSTCSTWTASVSAEEHPPRPQSPTLLSPEQTPELKFIGDHGDPGDHSDPAPIIPNPIRAVAQDTTAAAAANAAAATTPANVTPINLPHVLTNPMYDPMVRIFICHSAPACCLSPDMLSLLTCGHF
jgi:hypothetical protein